MPDSIDKEIQLLTDNCREKLNCHTERACELLPPVDNPAILDLGCGTGVPTMILAERFNGAITAVDPDRESINRLQEKIKESSLNNRVTAIPGSFTVIEAPEGGFDIFWAEGVFNIIGFRRGLEEAAKMLRPGGHLVIHDELAGREEKPAIMNDMGFELLNSFEVSADEWLGYFRCIARKLEDLLFDHGGDPVKARKIEEELEINRVMMKSPLQLGSLFYITLKKSKAAP